MKKTTDITLGGMRFAMTEESYQALDTYLTSLTEHLNLDDDRTEIIRDIEARIAEKFKEGGEEIISLATVEAVVSQMGSPEDIVSEDDNTPLVPPNRKLYRNLDSAILGGVASGIAAYLGIDSLYVRLIFIISIFFGGTGIFLYILLWLLLPPARTASQKLEMRGSAVTLKTMQDLVRSGGDAGTRHGTLRRLVYFPFELVGSTLRGIRRHLPKAGKFLGVLIAIGSFFAILGITTLLVLTVVSMNASYVEFPLLEAVSPVLLYSLLATLYLSAIIPFIFLLALAQRLVRTAARIAPSIGFGLVGLWSLSVIASGTMGFHTFGEYHTYLSTSPAYQVSVQEMQLEPYHSIEMPPGVNVTIASGDTQRTEATARQLDLDRLITTVRDGVLTIEVRPAGENCMFCDVGRPTIAITTPNLESINMQGGTVVFENFEDDFLSIEAYRGRISGSMNLSELTVEGEQSHLELMGSVASTTLMLDRTNVRAARLAIQHASVEAHDYSTAELWVLESLNAYVDQESEVVYRGSPATTTGNAKMEDQSENVN